MLSECYLRAGPRHQLRLDLWHRGLLPESFTTSVLNWHWSVCRATFWVAAGSCPRQSVLLFLFLFSCFLRSVEKEFADQIEAAGARRAAERRTHGAHLCVGVFALA